MAGRNHVKGGGIDSAGVCSFQRRRLPLRQEHPPPPHTHTPAALGLGIKRGAGSCTDPRCQALLRWQTQHRLLWQTPRRRTDEGLQSPSCPPTRPPLEWRQRRFLHRQEQMKHPSGKKRRAASVNILSTLDAHQALKAKPKWFWHQ